MGLGPPNVMKNATFLSRAREQAVVFQGSGRMFKMTRPSPKPAIMIFILSRAREQAVVFQPSRSAKVC
jgi:hypothetical protein